MKLKNKVAVITGGNSGIGLGIAEEFKSEGASGVISGRNAKTLSEAKDQLGPNFIPFQGDITKMDDIDKLYQTTTDKYGKIDVLVVNAGMATFIPFDQIDESTFDSMNDLNFKGAFFTIQKALPHLNDGASIILISSVANSKGFPATTVYSATKAALRSLARTISSELLERRIRVNTLSPGPIDTPIFHRAGVPEEAVEGMKDQFTQMVPMKRLGTSREIGTAAVFLASQDSSYVVGEELQVDGGMANL